jgi:hypothetical protein
MYSRNDGMARVPIAFTGTRVDTHRFTIKTPSRDFTQRTIGRKSSQVFLPSGK